MTSFEFFLILFRNSKFGNLPFFLFQKWQVLNNIRTTLRLEPKSKIAQNLLNFLTLCMKNVFIVQWSALIQWRDKFGQLRKPDVLQTTTISQ